MSHVSTAAQELQSEASFLFVPTKHDATHSVPGQHLLAVSLTLAQFLGVQLYPYGYTLNSVTIPFQLFSSSGICSGGFRRHGDQHQL